MSILLVNEYSLFSKSEYFKFAIEVTDNIEILKHTVNNYTECVGS